MSAMQAFREWASRQTVRGCACQWEDSEKCAKQKHLASSRCPCACHESAAPPELDAITDIVLNYKPKPKTKAQKKRLRKAKRDAKAG